MFPSKGIGDGGLTVVVERERRVWIIRRVLTHLVAVVIAYAEGRSSLSNIELFDVSSTGVAPGEGTGGGKNFIELYQGV